MLFAVVLGTLIVWGCGAWCGYTLGHAHATLRAEVQHDKEWDEIWLRDMGINSDE